MLEAVGLEQRRAARPQALVERAAVGDRQHRVAGTVDQQQTCTQGFQIPGDQVEGRQFVADGLRQRRYQGLDA